MQQRAKNIMLGAGMASVFALSVAFLASEASPAELKGASTSPHCADLTFGGTQYGQTEVATSASYSTENLNVNLSSSEKAFCPSQTSHSSSAYALKLGSAKANGSITFSFSSLPLTALRVLAFSYGSDVSTLTVKDDASYSSSRSIAATSGAQLDDCLGSDWLSFTGFDGAVNSLTFTSVKRLNLAKIVFVLNADSASSVDYSSYSSSASISSSEQSSSSSSPSSYSLSDTSDSWSAYQNGSYTNYVDLSSSVSNRIEPIVSSTSTVDCYARRSDGVFYVAETLSKGGVYIDPNEVALYYQAFQSYPANYSYYTSSNVTSVKSSAYQTYGKKARLWTTYSKTSGYVKGISSLNTSVSGFEYYEVDIDVDGTYANSATWSRGGGRLVIFPYGVKQSGYATNKPLIVKTLDHYAHAREFSNYLEGWGSNFDFETQNNGYGSYSPLTTISIN